MLTYWETLIATRSNIAVNDSYAQLWGRKLSNAYTVETYSGTLPATLTGTKVGYLESYKIYGNTEQNGTPTPENPIMPSGCGERTGNLFDLNRLPSNTWTTDTQYYMNGGIITNTSVNPENVSISVNNDTLSVTSDGGRGAGFLVEVEPSTEYRFTFTKSESLASDKTSCVYAFVDTSETLSEYNAIYGNSDSAVFTTGSNTKYVYFVFRKAVGSISYSNIMLVESSTALPYEPHGYKLPLISGNTSVDIYLGEVETTRRIRKQVLTGNENFIKNNTVPSNYLYYGPRNSIIPGSIKKTPLMCDELPMTSETPVSQIGISANNPYNVIYINFGADVMNAQSSGNTVNGFKEYLAAQYAAGTPVTVWYVLAEPETGIVNEPLMKIGDYADTIDSTQASTRIPTAPGETTISWAGEGIAPSEVEFVYKVKR